MILNRSGQAHLFNGNDPLILAEFALFLGLLEAILPVVHDFAHRRTGLRSNLHQIQLHFLRHVQRLLYGHYAQLRAILIHYTHFTIADLLVNHEIVNTDAPPDKFAYI